MPITPFHFGPGLLFKAYAPAWISWTTFALANMLIDLEPLAGFLLVGDPAHRQLHSYLGASGMALLAIWPGRLLCERWLVWWNRQLSPAQARWLGTGMRITLPAATLGAALGAYSHILLDSFMHGDMQPFWPWQEVNGLLAKLPVATLHVLCVATALWGGLRMALAKHVSLPGNSTGRALRALGRLADGVALGGVLLLALIFAIAAFPPKHTMDSAAFDAPAWRQVPPKTMHGNPRMAMANATLAQLRTERPERELLGTRLGTPDAQDTPALASYHLGFTGLGIDPYTLDIEFSSAGQFVDARIVQH